MAHSRRVHIASTICAVFALSLWSGGNEAFFCKLLVASVPAGVAALHDTASSSPLFQLLPLAPAAARVGAERCRQLLPTTWVAATRGPLDDCGNFGLLVAAAVCWAASRLLLDEESKRLREAQGEVGELRGQVGRLESSVRERVAFGAEFAKAYQAQADRFLAMTSHEMRTPLNGVIGNVHLLLSETKLTSEQRELTNTIRMSSETLLSIINDILDYSKLEAGQLVLEELEFDLEEIVQEAAASLAASTHGKQLELVSFVDPSLPPTVIGDSLRLRQILLNLLSNALKFTPTGHVVVRALQPPTAESRKSADAGSGVDTRLTVRFEVEDSGVGLEEAAIQRLFKPFTQASASTSRTHGGTGLGLSICRQLVSLMGGDIGMCSKPGRGTTCWFTVNLRLPPPPRPPFVLPPLSTAAVPTRAAVSSEVRPVLPTSDVPTPAAARERVRESGADTSNRAAIRCVSLQLPHQQQQHQQQQQQQYERRQQRQDDANPTASPLARRRTTSFGRSTSLDSARLPRRSRSVPDDDTRDTAQPQRPQRPEQRPAQQGPLPETAGGRSLEAGRASQASRPLSMPAGPFGSPIMPSESKARFEYASLVGLRLILVDAGALSRQSVAQMLSRSAAHFVALESVDAALLELASGLAAGVRWDVLLVDLQALASHLLADGGRGPEQFAESLLARYRTRVAVMRPASLETINFVVRPVASPSSENPNIPQLTYVFKPLRRKTLFGTLADMRAGLARESSERSDSADADESVPSLSDGREHLSSTSASDAASPTGPAVRRHDFYRSAGGGSSTDSQPSDSQQPQPQQQMQELQPQQHMQDLQQAPAPRTQPPPTRTKGHALLAEDNAVNQKLMVRILEKFGWSVTVVTNGQECVDQFAAHPARYEVIFMDCRMPVMDGLTATQRIRRLPAPEAATVPIVALTASASNREKDECVAAGMSSFCAKPVVIGDIQRLLQQIEKSRVVLPIAPQS